MKLKAGILSDTHIARTDGNFLEKMKLCFSDFYCAIHEAPYLR